MFVNLCKLLHGMVDGNGLGVPFNISDLSVCFKGIGADDDCAQALNDCLHRSTDQHAAREIRSQISRLGREAHKCFSGVVGVIDKFQSPLVNAYEPDIVFEDVLQNNEMVYVQLPANLFKIQAPAMGKVMLMDVQQEGSLRQVFRRTRNQIPFSVTVDEFYNFADLSIIDSLNKLRDANLEFTLAHQSIADLELVSKEFASAVWDNTTVRDILAQDNPDLCEKLARSIGTHQVVEKTVRMRRGPLFTSLATGDVSSKLALPGMSLQGLRVVNVSLQLSAASRESASSPRPRSASAEVASQSCGESERATGRERRNRSESALHPGDDCVGQASHSDLDEHLIIRIW